jgi:hypothetical protein
VSINILFAERFTNPNFHWMRKISEEEQKENTTKISSKMDDEAVEVERARKRRLLQWNKLFKRMIKTFLFQESFEVLAILGCTAVGERLRWSINLIVILLFVILLFVISMSFI